MKKLLFILLVLFVSCNSTPHYHDGEYKTKIDFLGANLYSINYTIKGDIITIDNSISGISYLRCEQYPDRIILEGEDTSANTLYVLKNGDLSILNHILVKQK